VSIDNARESDPARTVASRAEPYLFKIGKRRFAKITIENGTS